MVPQLRNGRRNRPAEDREGSWKGCWYIPFLCAGWFSEVRQERDSERCQGLPEELLEVHQANSTTTSKAEPTRLQCSFLPQVDIMKQLLR